MTSAVRHGSAGRGRAAVGQPGGQLALAPALTATPARRASDSRQQNAAVTAETTITDGQAPITSPSTCEIANASNPVTVSLTAVERPSRRNQMAMQPIPRTAITAPPNGRDPLATATPKPPIRPAAAIGAVGTRSANS
jgi:hypothetical protein